MNITIIGGGATGWMAAAFLQHLFKNSQITVVESAKVGTIGVGESVTSHLLHFLNFINVDETEMMFKTGSIYKYGNNFINWTKDSTPHHFALRWNLTALSLRPVLDESLKYTDPVAALAALYNTDADHYRVKNNNYSRLTDAWLSMHQKNCTGIEFDSAFSSHDHIIKNNKSPHVNGLPLFKRKSVSHGYHINAEKFGDYIKNSVAIPRGVNHKIGHVDKIILDSSDPDCIDKIVLDDGSEIVSDVFLDCTGMHRALISQLNRKWKHYINTPGDSVLVCQVDYDDPSKEMSSYTKSTCMTQGWAFDISLYHRKGTGYIFSSELSNESTVLSEFEQQMLTRPRFNPRKIKWERKRLQESAKGNVVAIGMSNGFVEPMEANVLALVVCSLFHLKDVLIDNLKNLRTINWQKFNNKIAHLYDDVADFILVHYTLSSRYDNDFWKEMRSIGQREKHSELLQSKYFDKKNYNEGLMNGLTIYSDFVWLQLAVGWGVDVSKWGVSVPDSDLQLFKTFIDRQTELTIECLDLFDNNFEFHKQHIFKNCSPAEIQSMLTI